MLIATSTYLVPLAEVDAARAAHLEWLAALVEDGSLVSAGRQDPPTGGVLVLRGSDPAAGQALLARDPYVTGGIARYDLLSFRAGLGLVTDELA